MDDNNKLDNYESEKPSKSGTPSKKTQDKLSFVKTLALFIAIAIVLRATVVEAYKIPSGSMLPTLQIGDHILVTKFNYGFRLPFLKKSLFVFNTPERGDIVVFTRPNDPNTLSDESSINIIKRVIGMPGDRVEIVNGQVFINENLLIEPYAVWIEGGEGHYGPYTIPTNNYLLLGDNRDQSKDSRYWHDPFLPIDLIKGKALIVYFNFSAFNRIGKLIK
mgnify:CR=1 FL=1